MSQQTGLSLEHKLPLLIGSLVAVSLITTLAFAYVEMRLSALETTRERLERVTLQLIQLTAQGVQRGGNLFRAAASEASVHDYLMGFGAREADARAVLQRLATGGRQDVRPDVVKTELRSTAGRILLEDPDTTVDALLPERTVAPAVPRAPSDFESGPMHSVDGRAMYWLSVPVVHDSVVIGYIDQLRRFGSPETASEVDQFVGVGTRVYLTHDDGGAWATVRGEVLENAPRLTRYGRLIRHRGAQGEATYAFADTIPSSGFVVVSEIPVKLAGARPAALLRRLVLIGLVLLALGGVAAWFVSRSVTRPLGQLAALADAIGKGDYSRRSGLRRDDEIGRLAYSFDTMLEQIDASHAEVGRRFEHAQILAVELETANQRLQSAILEAENARVEAQEANSAKSAFLATMSHEIRTPINAMIGYTDLLETGVAGELPPRQQEYVERIRISGQHLIAIVNDVLDFAKIESGQLRLHRQQHAARDVIEAAINMFEARASARNVRIEIDCPTDLLYYGDRQRVQQILLNLLSNAIKFTSAGGRVTLGGRETDRRSFDGEGSEDATTSWTCISVTDTGSGISRQQLATIFEPFVQGARGYTRPHGGTGLGLTISRSLAQMMKGELTVESQPGEGSTFTLWLPHPTTAPVPQPV